MKPQLRTHLPDEARTALALLSKPWACARELKLDRWDFALWLLQLQKLGVGESDLQWLILNGYVDQADDVTTYRDPARRFQPRRSVAFGDRTCFVLTEAGASVACQGADSPPGRPANSAEIASFSPHLPHWDRKRRQLLFDECVVKEFRLPASNQEAVLSAFEEEGWPPSIDDPLPFLPGRLRPKQRLHSTIRYLNGNQANRLLRFRGNGTGEAVLWEPIAVSALDRPGAILETRRAA
jgi:hypothetical protein